MVISNPPKDDAAAWMVPLGLDNRFAQGQTQASAAMGTVARAFHPIEAIKESGQG